MSGLTLPQRGTRKEPCQCSDAEHRPSSSITLLFTAAHELGARLTDLTPTATVLGSRLLCGPCARAGHLRRD